MPWVRVFIAKVSTMDLPADFVPKRDCTAKVFMEFHLASFAPLSMLGVISDLKLLQYSTLVTFPWQSVNSGSTLVDCPIVHVARRRPNLLSIATLERYPSVVGMFWQSAAKSCAIRQRPPLVHTLPGENTSRVECHHDVSVTPTWHRHQDWERHNTIHRSTF